ncbi:Golgi apparatus membrane protein TVP38 [Pseudozyma hubeiensis]|nr:Golgi apparatus membrane protein TVP38 [Pseudozyma hubeiensis]
MSRITNPDVQRQAISALHTSDPSTASSAPRDDDTISIRSRHTLRAFHTTDEEDDPWSAIPRTTSSTPDSASALTLTREQRKRLILRSLLQLLALFVVCLVGLGGTLWLALPVISPDDKPFFKLPRSFEDLRQLNSVLQHYKSTHFWRVLLCWTIIYLFLQAFSIPGSMYMSILAGALFGVPIALPLVCTSVATGATICYLISKFLGAILVAIPSWKAKVDEWKEKVDEHSEDLLSYLVVLRMMPLPPHNIVNILSPHLGIGVGTFWLSTFGGIFAVSVIHTTIGEKLDEITGEEGFTMFTWRNVLLLGGVMAAVMLPVVLRRMKRGEEQQGQVFLDDIDEPDAQHLPESFRRNLSSGFESDDDDELPHRSLDTHNMSPNDDSFPNWTSDGRSSLDDEQDDDVYGRGGVFRDRNDAQQAQERKGTAERVKKWFGGSTGINL